MESLNRDFSDNWTARVLVVDDEETVREAIAHLLVEMRCIADAATSGEEAIVSEKETINDRISIIGIGGILPGERQS